RHLVRGPVTAQVIGAGDAGLPRRVVGPAAGERRAEPVGPLIRVRIVPAGERGPGQTREAALVGQAAERRLGAVVAARAGGARRPREPAMGWDPVVRVRIGG